MLRLSLYLFCKSAIGIVAVLLCCAPVSARSPPYDSAHNYLVRHEKRFSHFDNAVLHANNSVAKLYWDRKAKGTVFAPNNAAMERFAKDIGYPLFALFNNPRLCNKLVTYHILLGAPLKAKDVPAKPTKLRTPLEGASSAALSASAVAKGKGLLTVRRGSKGVVRLISSTGKHAKVVRADIKAGRMIIHEINRVLVPPISTADRCAFPVGKGCPQADPRQPTR